MTVKIQVPEKSGTLWGKILGGAGMVAGAAAAPFTGGASLGLLPAIGAGAGLGGAAGTLVGTGVEAVSAKTPHQGIGVSGDSPIQRRLESKGPGAMDHIQNAMSVVGSLPPVLQEQYRPPLEAAIKGRK